MVNTPIIYWFRHDLRLRDLPALAAAAATGRPILPLYVLDDKNPSDWQPGAASQWWLHHSLIALSGQLNALDGRLHFFRGDPASIIPKLARQVGASGCSFPFRKTPRIFYGEILIPLPMTMN